MRKTLLILFLATSTLFSSVFVTSKGCSIVGDNMESARILALEEAKKNAIEKAKGVIIRERLKVVNGILNEYTIAKEIEGMIEKYDIIEEWKEKDMFCVEIGAFVDDGEAGYDVSILSSDTRFLPFFEEILRENGFKIFESPSSFFNTIFFDCELLSSEDIIVYGEKLKHIEMKTRLSLHLPDSSVRNFVYSIAGNGFDENQAIEDAFEKNEDKITSDIKSAFISGGKIFLMVFLDEEDEVKLDILLSNTPNVMKFEKFEKGLEKLYRVDILGDPISIFLRIGREFGDKVSVIRKGGIYEINYSSQ